MLLIGKSSCVSSRNGPFSIAMLNNVYIIIYIYLIKYVYPWGDVALQACGNYQAAFFPRRFWCFRSIK